jgi:tetratricopeptide (TPR) repeat protein
MAGQPVSKLPRLTPEQRRAAAGQYDRANQVLANGDYDYALPLLMNCCLIDPANPVYRQVLRQATKNKYGNNQRGQKLSYFTSLRDKFRLRKAQLAGDHLKVLEHGEHILLRNPWDVPAHLAMAGAFDELDLNDLAVWTLEQARQTNGDHVQVNRFLARLYEKRGNFNQAIALWQLVRKVDPSDIEAHNKAKDLAASATIAKGRYQQVLLGDAPTPMVQHLTGQELPSTDSVPDVAMTENDTPAPADDRLREVPALMAKIKTNPTNPLGYIHLAKLYRRVDEFDKARAVLKEGLEATGGHFELAMELVDIDIEPFRRDLAVTEDMLRRDAENPELQAIRTRLLKEINTRELDFYRQRCDRFPTDTPARFEMSLRLMKVGQIDEAIKELQGLRADPRHQSKVLVYLGFCFKSRNNWRLAQRNFEAALQHLSPQDEHLRKEVLYQLAQGYAEAGELARAVDLAVELGNLDFAYKNIGQLLDQWQARLQKA